MPFALNLCYFFINGNFRLVSSLFKVPQPDRAGLLKYSYYKQVTCLLVVVPYFGHPSICINYDRLIKGVPIRTQDLIV
jgi:hypothetical protein